MLQDTFGLDVNLLLYAAWLAHMDRRLSGEHLAGLEAEIVDWREQGDKAIARPAPTIAGLPPGSRACARRSKTWNCAPNNNSRI